MLPEVLGGVTQGSHPAPRGQGPRSPNPSFSLAWANWDRRAGLGTSQARHGGVQEVTATKVGCHTQHGPLCPPSSLSPVFLPGQSSQEDQGG